MNPITSIYIPCIEKYFDAQFIADVFDKNQIAKVSKIYLEPNNAYIEIKSWYDTESAYNFIERLRNPNREARIIYNDDDWWPVYINKNNQKIHNVKRVLTIFQDKFTDLYNHSITIAPLVNQPFHDFVSIDVQKTNLLRNIIANFKNTFYDDTNDDDTKDDKDDKDDNDDNDDNDDYTFDNYLREIHYERNNCFYQQPILSTF